MFVFRRKHLLLCLITIAIFALAVVTVWHFRETPETARAARQTAVHTVRRASSGSVITVLRDLIAEKRPAFSFDKKAPWISFRYGPTVPPDTIAQLAYETFPRFFGAGNPNKNDVHQLHALMAVCDDISKFCSEKMTELLLERRLDACFLVHDYEGAIAILQRGGMKRSKTWTNGSIAKLRAQQAMADGDRRSAVKWLLEFDKCLKAEDPQAPAERDPASGVTYSRHWVIARNLMHAANILASISAADREKATKLALEARDYYRLALKDARGDKKSLAVLNDETKSFGL